MRSSGSTHGNIKHKLRIPFDKADQISPASRTPFMIESDKAYGFKVNGQAIWMPKSQVDEFYYRFNDHEQHIEFWAPRWLIEAKALEYFIDTSGEPGLFDE